MLVSNNFAEIKSNVFKRYSKANVHSLVYLDSVERFHILAFILFVLAQNILEAEGPWFESFLSNALVVYLCEVMIDVIKHSFIAKFNDIKPIAFSEFLEDLCKQTLNIQTENEKKNLTFVPLAPACVVIRVLSPVYSAYLPYGPCLWRLFCMFVLFVPTFLMLASLKMMIGMGLQKHARCEGLITFTRIFSPEAACDVIEAEMHSHVFYEAEPDIWMVMVVEKSKESEAIWRIDALQRVLKEVHSLFVMFHGSVRTLVDKEPTGGFVRSHLYYFIMDYLSDFFIGKKLQFPNFCNSLKERGTVQRLTVGREAAIDVQSLVRVLESCAGNSKCYSLTMFQDLLVSTTLSPDDTVNVYSYAVLRLTPQALSYGLHNLTVILLIPVSSVLNGVQGIAMVKQQILENASLKMFKVEEKLSRGWGGENAYHVSGYRYLLVDSDRYISRASPPGKVTTLTKDSLIALSKLREEVDSEKIRANSDGLGYEKDLEVCIRAKNSAWLIARLTRGKELYMVLEKANETLLYASDAVEKFSDRYCNGAFSLE
ncbi:unnamed protein product [Fraxinus pennsylvanica]|uniref:CCZ1/INTU/HSP4 first Longin domain-containing protein n=1 Tax=Fraxinus pennsylvanica TaxID=56036 RepID=A0AAD1Z5N3_9LAMI|nr:unnamed protein product [Fraxinus pennsylvanica]